MIAIRAGNIYLGIRDRYFVEWKGYLNEPIPCFAQDPDTGMWVPAKKYPTDPSGQIFGSYRMEIDLVYGDRIDYTSYYTSNGDIIPHRHYEVDIKALEDEIVGNHLILQHERVNFYKRDLAPDQVALPSRAGG